jgi:hypothetical protein
MREIFNYLRNSRSYWTTHVPSGILPHSGFASKSVTLFIHSQTQLRIYGIYAASFVQFKILGLYTDIIRTNECPEKRLFVLFKITNIHGAIYPN